MSKYLFTARIYPRKRFMGWPNNTSTSSTLGIKQFIKEGALSTLSKDNVLSQAKRKFPTTIKNGAGETNDLLKGLAPVFRGIRGCMLQFSRDLKDANI